MRGRLVPTLDDGASRVVSLRIVVSFLVSSANVRHRPQSIRRNTPPRGRNLVLPAGVLRAKPAFMRRWPGDVTESDNDIVNRAGRGLSRATAGAVAADLRQ